jgi:hypothetical protein
VVLGGSLKSVSSTAPSSAPAFGSLPVSPNIVTYANPKGGVATDLACGQRVLSGSAGNYSFDALLRDTGLAVKKPHTLIVSLQFRQNAEN